MSFLSSNKEKQIPKEIKIKKFFINKRTGQVSCVLPKKLLIKMPKKAIMKYW